MFSTEKKALTFSGTAPVPTPAILSIIGALNVLKQGLTKGTVSYECFLFPFCGWPWPLMLQSKNVNTVVGHGWTTLYKVTESRFSEIFFFLDA